MNILKNLKYPIKYSKVPLGVCIPPFEKHWPGVLGCRSQNCVILLRYLNITLLLYKVVDHVKFILLSNSRPFIYKSTL